MQQDRIIFVGGGNMTEAICMKLINKNIEIIIIQRNPEKLKTLSEKYPKIKFISKLDFATNINDIVVLAIKPQDAKVACMEIQENVKYSTIVSIMAGINTSTIQSWLSTNKIIRVMPNTPSSVGYGVTTMYFTSDVSSTRIELIQLIFNSIGKTYVFQEEKMIDKTTPVSGSSPAYTFYFMEAMIEAAINKFNLDYKTAKEMIVQVVKGSVAMVENNPDIEIKELRSNVTSRKGATEAAINVFDNNKFKDIILEAETACYKRTKELSELFK